MQLSKATTSKLSRPPNRCRRPIVAITTIALAAPRANSLAPASTSSSLKKSGRTWDASIEERASLDDIDPASIQRFLKDAEQTGRLPDAADLAPADLLRKLRLARGDQLTCAALVLFGKDPAEFYPGISVRIGRFGASDADLQFQEVVEGNLIDCLREALNQILGKFTIKPIRFEGIQRIESPQYPIEALREILLNAMVHRRYQSGVHVQIRVYADRIICWNEGPLPQELTIETLLGLHSSYPRNPLIADACFKAGYIDSWGRGIQKIKDACLAADLPEPTFEEAEGGMRVTLFAAKGAEPTEQVTEQVSEQVATLLRVMENKTKYTRAELMQKVSLKHRVTFHTNYLKPALENDFVEMTIPEKPTSRLQKYRLTQKGERLLK
jgi:ATP-dependent DNA helicase RecG